MENLDVAGSVRWKTPISKCYDIVLRNRYPGVSHRQLLHVKSYEEKNILFPMTHTWLAVAKGWKIHAESASAAT